MTLKQLQYFIEIVNSGSINKAAEKLYIAQSSLSKAISDLEKEIGEELLIRTAQGVSVTLSGAEFLGYARQVVEQADLLEQRWISKKPSKRLITISTQHYAFAVNAFVNMVKKTKSDEYEYTFREARTFDIVEDVKYLRSEIGIIYMNDFNKKVMTKLLKESNLIFNSLFIAKPHVFISKNNPLAKKEIIKLSDLKNYPRLSFEQGDYNSFYFSEEILSTEYVKKDIKVGDRATVFNLMIGLNGYTISTGIVCSDLNGEDIISIPLDVKDSIEVGWISHKDTKLSAQGRLYINELKNIVGEYNIKLQ